MKQATDLKQKRKLFSFFMQDLITLWSSALQGGSGTASPWFRKQLEKFMGDGCISSSSTRRCRRSARLGEHSAVAGCWGCFHLDGGGLAEPCSPPAAGVPLAPPSSPGVEGRPRTGKHGLGEPVGCAEPEAERCLAETWLWVAQGVLLLLYLLLPHLQ